MRNGGDAAGHSIGQGSRLRDDLHLGAHREPTGAPMHDQTTRIDEIFDSTVVITLISKSR